jgi:ABC-type polysaccharide/polyol phosphate export permease
MVAEVLYSSPTDPQLPGLLPGLLLGVFGSPDLGRLPHHNLLRDSRDKVQGSGRRQLAELRYLYCGYLPFLTYSDALTKGLNSIRNNSGLIQKVIFPLEFLPFTTATISLIDKFFGLGALLATLVALEHRLYWTVLLLPLVIVPQLVFILGLTYLMAVAGTYMPDIGEALRPIVRGTFFLTPILWPASAIPENLRFLVDYNPLAYLVEAYRDLILNGELPGGMATLYFSLFAGALFIAGFTLFVKVKPQFADLL